MGQDKLTLPLLGKPLLIQTLEPFLNWPRLQALAVSVSPGREQEIEAMIADHFTVQRDKIQILAGGKERQDSIRLALEALSQVQAPQPDAQVLIHDGARPFVNEALFERVLSSLTKFSGVIPAIPVRDTVKRVDGQTVLRTEDRQTLRLVQTPQAFLFENILECHQRAHRDGFLGTDDASLLEHYGQTVGWVEGPVHNLKVTVLEDIPMMEELAKQVWGGVQ